MTTAPKAAPVRIAPSILAADFAKLGDEVRAVAAAGADWIHIDIMDGHFVPNLTIGPGVVTALRAHCELPFDVHLMISPVDAMIAPFAKAGADVISLHPEAGPHMHRSLQTIRSMGKKAGVVLHPATPVTVIDEVMDMVDLILVMSVNPGFGGQTFIESQLEKIAALRTRIDAHVAAGGQPIDLEVDGGIDRETAPRASMAGANIRGAGTAKFRGGPDSYADNIAAMRNSR